MRKGQAEYLHWFVRLAMMVVAMLVVVILIRFFVDRQIDDHQVREAAIYTRIVFDQYAYEENGRPYVGVIDMAKFQDIPGGGEFGAGAARLTLMVGATEKAQVYVDKTTFDRYYALAKNGVRGRQSGSLIEHAIPVTVVEGTNRYPAQLKIDVVTPNT